MSKRSATDKISLYKRKIKKLEQENSRRKRIIVYTDSSSDSEENNDVGTTVISNNNEDNTANDIVTGVTSLGSRPELNNIISAETPELILDPELLLALGDPVVEEVAYGGEILPDLAQRWTPILRKGLDKEVKEKLLKEYNIPSNCKLLRAPSLNPEIAAASSDIARGRDKKLENNQQVLGLGITAINRAMSLLLKGENKTCAVLSPAVKILSDSVRILSHLHFDETLKRSKMLMSGLDKAFINVIQDCERDETLFGAKLPDKIKALKAIEKQGTQIKKLDPKNSAPGPSSPRSTRHQGNWRSPSRSLNRGGGRGGLKSSGRITTSYNRKIQTPVYNQTRNWPNKFQRASNYQT